MNPIMTLKSTMTMSPVLISPARTRVLPYQNACESENIMEQSKTTIMHQSEASCVHT
jgi:hypothetical protein